MNEIKRLKVEYLVIIATKTSFCNSKKSFNSLLSSFDDITIKGNKVKHKNLEVEYELQTEEIKADEQRFFHLTFICKDTNKVEEFNNLLRTIKAILHKVGEKQPQKLWDDISKYYSFKLYPIIHDIENLMRKLITKFMLTNIVDWEKSTIPQEVKGRTKPSNSNYLYEVDFIQLSNFLFAKYETIESSILLEKISSVESITDLNLEELKDFIPKSNWERYFSPMLDCTNKYIETRWKKLYDYRCKIAHNNDFNKSDYDNTIKLYDEVREKLQEAIDNLDKIHLTEEDKELIAENIAGRTNELYGKYINYWKFFTLNLYTILSKNEEFFLKYASRVSRHKNGQIERLKYSANQMISIFAKAKLISRETFMATRELNELRNILVHEPEVLINDNELFRQIVNLKKVTSSVLTEIEENFIHQNNNETIITEVSEINN